MPIILGGSVGTGSAALSYATVAQLIARCRWRLEDRPLETVTTGTITDSAATLTVADGTLFGSTGGDWFEWDDATYEEAMVASVSGNTLTLTGGRGHLGSTAAAHGSGVKLLIRPRYPRQQLYQAILNALAGTWPRFYSPVTQSLSSLSISTKLYEANSDAEGIIGATQKTTSTTTDVAEYRDPYSTHWDGVSYYPIKLRRFQPTATFASGKAWYIPILDNTTNAITVTYPAIPTITTVIEGLMADWIVCRAVAEVAMNKQLPRTSQDMAASDDNTAPLDMARLAAQMRQEANGIAAKMQADLNTTYQFRRWHG